jgi:cell wall-associated NlpC family hydrolase
MSEIRSDMEQGILDRRSFLGTAVGVLALGVAGSFLPWGTRNAFAEPTSAEKQAEADEVSAQLDQMRQELDIASRNYYLAIEAHDEAVVLMNEAQGRIDAAQAQLNDAQGRLRARAASMYRSGPLSYLEVLFGSTSFAAFTNNWDILNGINEDTATLINQTKSAKRAAEDAHAEFTAQEKIAADKMAEAEQIEKQAEQTVADYETLLANLEAEVAELVAKEEEEERQRQAAALAAATSGYDGFRGNGASNYGGVAGIIVDAAYSQLGVPYVWGGTSPGVGLDCSGLTQWCYRQAGISIPRVDTSQRAAATSIIPVTEAQPGDILWKNGHVGIYIGGGQYIHAPYTGTVVQINANMAMWTCACRY